MQSQRDWEGEFRASGMWFRHEAIDYGGDEHELDTKRKTFQ